MKLSYEDDRAIMEANMAASEAAYFKVAPRYVSPEQIFSYAYGSAWRKAHNNQVDIAFKCKHPVSLNNIQGLAANATPDLASDLGHKLAVESGSFGLVYSYNGAKGEWMFNLRSNGDFDVTEIATYFGGGGHKNAAGFTQSVLPF
jgi:DHHA1 domain